MRLVVGDASWAADIPDWILQIVESERMLEGFIGLMKPEALKEEVSDAEVVCYLMPASMRAPMDHDMAEIYVWVAARLAQAHGRMDTAGFMAGVLEKGLTRDQERELRDLRRDLWQKRGGKVRTPFFDVLHQFKKDCEREAREEANRPFAGTLGLFDQKEAAD